MSKLEPHGYRRGIRWGEFFAIQANRELYVTEIAAELGTTASNVRNAASRLRIDLPDGRTFNAGRDMEAMREVGRQKRQAEKDRKERQAAKLARFKAVSEQWAAQTGAQS